MARKLSQLEDVFAAPALDTTVWNGSSGSPVLDTVLDRVQLSCTASYTTLGATGPYDATSDAIYARITPAPVGNGSTQTIMRIYVDASNSASLYDGGGSLTAAVVNAGTTTSTVIGTYDPYNHVWWRLREAGGTIYFETAPDGWTWTTRASLNHTWPAIAVSAAVLCGYTGTESAGMAAYVDHVSTTASAPGMLNLNWPLIEDGWGPLWNANGGTQPLDRYVDVSDRTRGSMTINRGRQYELDQVRSGEVSLRLANTDGWLDPTNTSGPWAGHIAPYQPYRRRAQWPPTRNLLDQVHATGGDLGGYSLGTIPGGAGGADVFSLTDSSGGTFVSSATAWQGSTVMQFAVPSGSTSGTLIYYTPRPNVRPGQTYTLQLRVRNVTPSTSLSVQAALGWWTIGTAAPYAYGSATTLTGSTTAGWTTLTVTGTAPANVGGVGVGISLAANAAATANVQVDGQQFEKGTVATTWQVPGIWYPMYAGWTERWPTQWEMDGTYGLVEPSLVDTFSLLSQRQLSDPLTQEISSHSPRFVFKLDDPAGSTSAADWTGAYPAVQLGISKYGAGSLTFGNAITATDATGTYAGSTGTVVTISNSNPGTLLISGGATFLKLTSSGIKGPADPTVWVRMLAFRYTGPMPTNAAMMWSAMDNQRTTVPSGSHIYVYLGTDGKPVLEVHGPTGAGGPYVAGGATNCVDGNWHLLIFGYNSNFQQIMFSQDGNPAAFYGSIPTTYTPTGIVADNLGGFVDATVGNGTTNNWKGDIAFACEFTSWFGSTEITNLYSAWKSACAGESSNARYARILRYAGYSGISSIQTGLTTSMGPASTDGQDAMSALQSIVDTENGAHYIDRNGWIQFRSRSARYNAIAPAYTFGERADLGEYPYEDCQLDYDSTHLSNQVTVTQEGTSQNVYAQDSASITAYFPRTMSRTINASSIDECSDAANYLLSRYRQPAQRISSLKLHPAANPALWPVCLGLELGTRARVMRRPPGLAATQVECFVENVAWDFDGENDAVCTIQGSPADLTPYGLFASWHTTLASSIASGVTSITVNAGQDNTNPLAAQIGAGQQLTLGQGTANAETVTVAAVGASSAGWTTATLTLTAATTKSHSSGNTVCEPLPAGVTDPTTWDAISKFDSAAFAY
ncbi:hypothetical protein [Streptomyces anandii]|uniref:hypothetical protein n=1 Tax=Streptomyces anandii TaxID=285454 RepID=UPI0037B2FE7C